MAKSKLLYSQNTQFLAGEIALPVNGIELYDYVTANTKPQNIREYSQLMIILGVLGLLFGCWMAFSTFEYITNTIPQTLTTDGSLLSILHVFGTAAVYVFAAIGMLYLPRMSLQTPNKGVCIKNAEALLNDYDVFHGRVIEIVKSKWKYHTRIHYEFDIDGQTVNDWFGTSSEIPLNIGDSVTIISDGQFHVLI